MEKEFIPYEEALALKELGFDEYCLALYSFANKDFQEDQLVIHTCKVEKKLNWMKFPVPLYQQAFRWFREKYNINVSITSKTLSDGKTVYISHGRTIPDTISKGLIVDIFPYRTDEIYEEAELRCLKELIKIIKNEK
jgi:hypothetical protein